MTPERFAAHVAAGSTRVPVMRTVLADLHTPLSAYLAVAAGPASYLFESVQGGERWGRYSIIGLPARTLLRIVGHEVMVETDGRIVEQHREADPLAFVERWLVRERVPEVPGLPRFTGGLVGYFGYDAVRWIEPVLADVNHADPLGCPDALLMCSDEVLVFDNLSGRLHCIVHADARAADGLAEAEARLEAITAALARAPTASPPPAAEPVDEADFRSGFGREAFEHAVRRIKDYIVDGDVMQVVLSQRLVAPYGGRPLDLYRALRCTNPSPYLYFLDLDDFHIAGSSPEILVRLEQGEVTVRPIAGTRPRGATPEQDLALERELLADPKELAEHLMLIDLGRNDVGRTALPGSVRLTERMAVERYSQVMHIVSNVTGRLAPGLGAFDVLRSAFPAGTLSGAPKIRAMEIIDELEPVKRGIYGGAVGYIGWQGNMDMAIAIRTAVLKDGLLHLQAGAGVVHDSVPAEEWLETMNKARAVMRAAALASGGLRAV